MSNPTDPLLISLMNFQIKNQNNIASANYDKISNIINDIERNALEIKKKQSELDSINNKLGYPLGVNIASIKSMDPNRGSILSLNPLPDMDNYQVNVNGKCLTVYGKNKVVLKNCQNGVQVSDSQTFHTTRIMTPLGAKTAMNAPYVNPNMVYPYNVFRSSISGQCMALNTDGDLVMQDCSPNNIHQHWKISPNENICP
jgi:hypothetical protein